MESRSRLFLVFTLGGLLLLTLLTGATAWVLFARIRSGEAALRARVAQHSDALERIRVGVLLSGTLARDYFLAPDEAMRERLRQLENDTTAQDTAPALKGEITVYWRLLDLMADMARTRRTAGLDEYFRRQLAQRRETMLGIADSAGAAIDAERRQGEAALEAMSRRFGVALGIEMAMVIALGSVAAAVTTRRMMRLERESRALSAQIVEAQEQERRSIARELHDEIGQSLSVLMIDLGTIGEAPEKLRPIAERLERTVEAVRRIALALRPSMLDDLGLVAALEWQARELGRRTGLDVAVQAAESAGDLPETHRTCIYRIAQEALQNCARHAQARHVRIGLERFDGRVALRVEDDGAGFRVDRTRGLGLLGMEERVAQLGGKLRVQSEPGSGTKVVAELPI